MKVSFDFDGTLSEGHIQDFASTLIGLGIEVWITTARLPEDKNRDLWEVCERLGIRANQVQMTSGDDKHAYLKKGFVWHMDDDVIELSMIQDYTDATPVCHLEHGQARYFAEHWQAKCMELCKQLEYSTKE